ncbi:MAG: FTR1 family iron permease [Nitrospiraceae bacterium]|nr:MAG: FTR1 family iron permease [Nitrospiraceae bacterium]
MIRTAIKTIGAILVVLVMAIGPLFAQDDEKLDYKGMVNEISGFLNEALDHYRKGNIQDAKAKVQAAYFEVFENLEGPIRINISASKNYELEEEFTGIRKMIVGKEPAAEVEKRINALMAELKTVVSELEGGHELIAESSDEAKHPGHDAPVETVWLDAVGNIESGLGSALDFYRKGDSQKAAELVVQTQFDDYKNSLLETAVRRYVSQGKDSENNSGFSDIASMIRQGSSPEEVGKQISMLVSQLREDLPGLPVVEGAVSGKETGKSAESDLPEKDWSKVNADLFQEIDRAVALYKSGETKDAVGTLQDAYFDVFEASGMEAKIGARDANFKAELEGHFTMIVGQMKKGIPVEKIEGSLAAMKGDFEKAASMLGKGKDSPMALFFYSLMIILREGIEAILIITAIIAYLVKTDHRDKLRVIYNGCISALVLSVITALLVKWVFKTSAASQEVMEGVAMLLASVVLFSVSYWLISKAEAQKWVSYIKEKVSSSLSTGSLTALWFASFLAVYREGAETVLFYQALGSGSGASGVTAIGGGFVTGCILLVGIYLGMRYGAVRLPIRPFFICTGALLYYMSFVFAGKGVMELISGKLFEPSLITWMPTISFIGVYPYVQTLVPQMLITLAALAGLAVILRQKSAVKEVVNE